MKKLKYIVKEIISSVVIALFIFFFISFFFRLGVVDGSSMETTYQDGNRVVILKAFNKFKVNDIVTFEFTQENEKFYEGLIISSNYQKMIGEQHLKRIVAVGGDHIVIKDGILFINNAKVSQTILYVPDQDYFVPEGSFFVQGDNVDNSFDSRFHGPIKEEQIYGRILTNKNSNNRSFWSIVI